MAGLGLLGLLPMSLAIHVWWMSLDNMAIAGSLPVESVAQGVIAHRSRGFSANPPLSLPVRGLSSTGPRIMLSIEPASVAAGAESESPVVFPGYLLPDDNREEPPHEGS